MSVPSIAFTLLKKNRHMLSLSASLRKSTGKKVKALRQKGVLPAVLYGPKIENQLLETDLKNFEAIFREAGIHTLISLEIAGTKKKYAVLIQEVKKDPVTGKPIHIDFYQPSLEEKITAKVSIVLEGVAPAVKDFGGTPVKNISELEIKALPQNLPKEIRLNINNLKTLEDRILVKDLKLVEGIEVLREPEDVIVMVTPPEKVEEELAKPVEQKVEEVEVVEQKKNDEKL